MGVVTVNNKVVQKRYDFPGTSLQDDWSLVALGAGMTVSVASSVLTIAAGTTADAVTVIRCSKTFQLKTLVRFIFQMSQRIINQTVYFEVVNQAGDTYARWLFDGTTNTTQKVESANRSTANSAVTLSSAPATSGYVVAEMLLEPEQVIFNMTATNSSAIKTSTSLFDRLIPEPGEDYYLQIRVVNGSVAPATNTNILVDAVVIEDITMLGVEILRASGDVNTATAMAVYARGGTIDTVSTITTAYSAPKSVRYTDTTTPLGSGATYTGTGRDAGSTNLYSTIRAFVTSNVAGTLNIEQSSDNTTFYATDTLAVGAAEVKVLEAKIVMRYVRVKYVNGGSAQGTFKLDTIFLG